MSQRLANRARGRARWIVLFVLVGVGLALSPLRPAFGADPDPDLQDAREQLESNLTGLFDRLDDLSQLADALPLSSLDPSDALDLANIFDDEVADATKSLKEKLADATADIENVDAFENRLDGLDIADYGGVAVNLGGPGADDADDAAVDGEPIITKTGEGATAVVDMQITLTATKQVNVPLQFATGIVDLMAAGSDGTFPVTVTLSTNTLHLKFDKSLVANPATATQALYLVTTDETPTLNLSATSSGADVDSLPATFGFSAVTVTGDVSFDIDYSMPIYDPDDTDQGGNESTGDGKITADEWSSIALEDLIFGGLTDDGDTNAVFAELRLDSGLIAGATDLTITYTDPSLTADDDETLNFDETAPLNDLRNFSAEEALGALMRLVTMLDGLQNTGKLDVNLPFLNGFDDPLDPDDSPTGTFSDAIRVAKTIQDAITDPDPDGDGVPSVDPDQDLSFVEDNPATDINEIGKPAFTDAQALEALLEDTDVLGVPTTVVMNTVGNQLEFSFVLSDEASQEISLGLGEIDILSAINLDDAADSVLTLVGGYQLNLGFALDLSEQPREDGAGIGSCTDGIDNGAPDADIDPDTNELDTEPGIPDNPDTPENEYDPGAGPDALDDDCVGAETLEQRVRIKINGSAPELIGNFGVLASDVDATARIGILSADIDDASLLVGSGTGEDGTGDMSDCMDGADDTTSEADTDEDVDDPDCRARISLDITNPTGAVGDDGWLTIEELFNVLGTNLDANLKADVVGAIPVSADLRPDDEGEPDPGSLGGGTITIGSVGDGFDGPITNALDFLNDLEVDADDLNGEELLNFSPCGNSRDDDGDGVEDDGCGTIPEEDESEASSTALLNQLFDTLRLVAEQLEAGGLIPADALETPLPLIGASFSDLVDFAESITALADSAELQGESAVALPGGADPCANADDDDFDGVKNDGCPTEPAGGMPEAGDNCLDSDSDDHDATTDPDTVVNDGCPAVAPSLQVLVGALGQYLERMLDVAGDATVAGSLDYDADADDLELILDADFEKTLPTSLTLDLPDPIGSLVSLDSLDPEDVALTLAADLKLAFGIGLDDLVPYIRGDSGLDLSAEAGIEDIFFSVGIGSLQVQVGQETPTGEEGIPDACNAGNEDDDDGDGFVNDGCPSRANPELDDDCGDKDDDDDDGIADDGCGDDNPAEDGDRAETGAECVDTNGEESDDMVDDGEGGQVLDDATPDDGCADDPAAASHPDGQHDQEGNVDPVDAEDDPECSLENVTDEDQDGYVNDGCGPRADRARFFLGAGVNIDAGTDEVSDDGTKYTFGDGGTLSFDIAFDGADSPQWCDDLEIPAGAHTVGPAPIATGDKDVCAVLPLFFNDQPVRDPASDPDDHHVLVAVEDLSSFDPSDITVHYDTTHLNSFIQAQLIDLFLMNSGLEALLNTLQSLLESDLFSFAVPILGGETASAADIIERLRASLHEAVAGEVGDGTGNVLDTPDIADAGDVLGVLNNIKAAIETALADPYDNADGTDSFDAPDDFTIGLLCNDSDPAEPCDTGAENDPDNPAVKANDLTPDDMSDNCEDPAATDDDGDGTINDGCPSVSAVADSAAEVSDVQFRFTLTDHIEIGDGPDGIPLDFDAAIPGLGISVTANDESKLNGGIDLSFAFGFGLSKDDGFYFMTTDLEGNDAYEIDLSADVAISEPGGNAELTAKFGFLEITAIDGEPADCASVSDLDEPCRHASDDDDPASSLEARFVVDVDDPDGRLTFDELSLNPDFGQLIRYGFLAVADVNLHVETGFTGDAGLPKLLFDLGIDWAFDIGNLPDFGEPVTDIGDLEDDADMLEPKDQSESELPSELAIFIDSVGVDAGSFVNKFLSPIFEDVSRFTKPLQPIIDTVKACIPVLTDLAGECQNLITLSEDLGLIDNPELIEVIIAIIELANDLGDFTADNRLVIPIGDGSFDLVGTTLHEGELQPEEAQSAFEDNLGSLGSVLDDMSTALLGEDDSLGDALGGADMSDSAGTDCSGKTGLDESLCKINVRIPVLQEPGKLLGILFGQDVDLIVWEPPEFTFGFSYSQKFGPIWSLPPVFLEVGGSVEFAINFGIGYSSKGFRLWALNDAGPAALLQGLFLVDKHPLEGGSDLNELELRGELFANAQVSVLIFSAGAGGSIFLTIGVDLQDPNGDGRLEFQEAADIINSTGNVLCIFNLNGQFGVRIFVFAEVDLFFWSQRWEKTLAEIILYEFKVECEPLPDPVLAHAESNVLILHVGDKRYLRDPEEWGSPLPYDNNPSQTEVLGDNDPDHSVGYQETNEIFKVVRTSNGVEITAFGVTQVYNGPWTEIEGHAGDGEDVIALVDGKVEGDPDPLAFNISADLNGGSEDDELTGSIVNDTLVGGGGADALTGRDGVNTIYGDSSGSTPDELNNSGDGNDTIDSGSGNDFLYGGGGDDRIGGGAGGDNIQGNDGDDTLDGGRGTSATPDGGDTIYGDNKDGSNSADDTDGADDSDTIDGGDADDFIYPAGGADFVNGGSGNDTIQDSGDDIACNQPDQHEDDVLSGGPGADTIDAGHGDDVVVGGSLVAGQPDVGDTRLNGGDECDEVWGDNVNRTDGGALFGVDPTVGGDDTIHGGDGDDELHGQVGNDTLDGDENDTDGGGTHASNADGDDTIYGDELDSSPQGNDDAFGDGGEDTIHGRGGDDDLVGGPDNDHVFGEDGADFLLGDEGTVTNTGTRDSDTVSLTGGSGNDDLHGGPYSDHLFGQGGRDDVFGDGGNDVGYGDGDGTSNANLDKNDLLRGGVGNDYLFGNNGADDIYGEQGDDRLVGGSPNSTSPDNRIGNDPDAGYDDRVGVTGPSSDDTTGATFQDEILGGSGHDVIAGDNATINSPATLLAEASIGLADLIHGEADNDTMYGENGADHIFGGIGDDHAEGGDDNDTIRGEDGQDDLIGGTTEAADGAFLGEGDQPDTGDDIRGGNGHDVIAGDNAKIERFETRVFQDLDTARGIENVERRVVTLYDIAELDDPATEGVNEEDADVGFSGAETIYGDDGYDIIYGQGGGDTLHGGLVDDYLEGNNGQDFLYGEEGQDDLVGGTGRTISNDSFSAKDDRLDDHDEMYGGNSLSEDDDDDTHGVSEDDFDVLMGDNATVLRPDNPDEDLTQWDVNTFNASIKRAVFLYDVAEVTNPVDVKTHGPDDMFGEQDADLMYGQGDGDTMEGAQGDDYMEGNDGADTIKGQGGNDDVAGGTGRINTDPPTGTNGRLDLGEVLIQGGPGFDTIAGDNAIIVRKLSDPGGAWMTNTYNGGIQHELIVLKDLATTASGEGTLDVDTSGGDTIEGNEDDDVLYGQGNDGDNQPPGEHDLMSGNSGDDYMEGNGGGDVMYGDTIDDADPSDDGEDDMLGGTGRLFGDPAAGVAGRLDGDDKMEGNGDHDAMTGDNAVVTRPLYTEDPDGDGPLEAGDWKEQGYRHFFDDEVSAEEFSKVVRDIKMIDTTAGTTSGSDLMRGSDGDDEMYGQLDDTGGGGGYAAAEVVAWCDLPVPEGGPKVHPAFADPDPLVRLAAVDAASNTPRGDVMCGDSGEDAMLGDNGEVNDIAEDGSRQNDNVRPNEPFIVDRIFVNETLTRETTLQQILLGGDDVIDAGPDGDSVHGGAGHDLLNGSLGDDRVFGDEGNDALWGGRDHDHLYGGYGGDFHDVRPRTATTYPPNGDPIAWFLFAPDDPATTQTKDVDGVPTLYEEYDGYQGVDYTYGGYDQDAHQANVGDAGPVIGDRLMDWAGSYNAYYLCPAVFGERVITRDMSPSLILFWETLGKGDGLQPTTVGEGKIRATDSGFNELAMVYKPDVRKNQKPVHPDTPGHFTCDDPLPAP